MFSLAFTAVVFALLSFEEGEPLALIFIASIGLLTTSLVYLYKQFLGSPYTNFLGLFCVSTNFWCVFALVQSIIMGAGSEWSFSRLINHPFTPIGSFASFSHYAHAQTYNAILFLFIFSLSYLSPVRSINYRLNRILFESIHGFLLHRRFQIVTYIFSSFVLLSSIAFGVLRGLGGGGYQDTLLGMFVQWTWLASISILPVGFTSVIVNRVEGLARPSHLPLFISIFSLLVFTLVLGRRAVVFVVVTFLWFCAKTSFVYSNDPKSSLYRFALQQCQKLKKPKSLFYLVVLGIMFRLLASVIDSYQILRTNSTGLSFIGIYDAFLTTLTESDDVVSKVRNESQAGRLLLLSPVAQLIARYWHNPITFQGNSFHELLDPFLNAIPAPILNIVNISKDNLSFGESSLTNALGYNVDFVDVISGVSFVSYGYLSLVIVPVVLVCAVILYYEIVLSLIGSSNVRISSSYVQSIKFLSYLSALAFIALGGLTDADLSTYIRIFLVSAFTAFLISLLARILNQSRPSN